MHTVTGGENLWTISNRYNIVMQDIVISNALHAPFVLTAGQRLKLPPPREYRVRAGDSLYSISRIFNTDRSQIARLNDLSAPYIVQPGQMLRLPSESAQQRYDAPVATNEPATYQTASVVQPVERMDLPPVTGQSGAVKPVPAERPQVQQAVLSQPKTKITAKTPKRSSSKFLTPVNGKVISKYGPKADGLHNDGINILAARGSPVAAAENGVVVYAGSELKGSGNLVLVRHADRWMTAYAHLDKIDVKRGQVINRGTKLGTVGSTGSVDTPQLHFEVRRGTEAINPQRYLES